MSDSCNPVDCSLPGSSLHGINQARILMWVAISFSRGSPNTGIEPGFPASQADSLLTELQGTFNEKETGTQNGQDVIETDDLWCIKKGLSHCIHYCSSVLVVIITKHHKWVA